MNQEEIGNETKSKTTFKLALLGGVAVLAVLVIAGIALLAGRRNTVRW